MSDGFREYTVGVHWQLAHSPSPNDSFQCPRIPFLEDILVRNKANRETFHLCPNVEITRAGTPAAKLLGGIECVTTAPAPIAR